MIIDMQYMQDHELDHSLISKCRNCYNYCNHVVIYTKAVCLFILKQYVICNINLFMFG